MGFIQNNINKLTNWLASFRRAEGIDLPSTGRSSDENLGSRMNSYLSGYSTISPIVNFEMLACLKNLFIFNPDMAQYVANITNLANTGHSVSVDAASESIAEAAVGRINETASRLYRNGAGVDGLINGCLTQIAWSGALSTEDVVNFAGRRVEQVVFVPVEQIRFKYDKENGVYIAFQKSSNLSRSSKNLGLIELHPETYRYYALQTIENSPYAKPPASAAIETIMESQRPMMENIRYMAQKLGLMGLVTANIAPPPKRPGETDAEHLKRCKDYRDAVASALEENFRKGLLVTFRDQKLEHTNITEGASGVYDINRISEEQVMSAFAMQPAFFGRTDSTTETYADVVYSLLLAQVHNFQRLVKRRQEATYRLDLRLGGLQVEGVSLKFNKTYSRNLLNENMADEIKVRVVLEKVKAGLITPDDGAQELGYESWADPDLLETDISLANALSAVRAGLPKTTTFAFRFDKEAQRYKLNRQTINLGSLLPSIEAENLSARKDNVLPLKKKTPQRALN